MAAKAQIFIPKGMQRDLSVSKADAQFSFRNHNIRITTRGEDTLLSITNEKGNQVAPLYPDTSFEIFQLGKVTEGNNLKLPFFVRPTPVEDTGVGIVVTYKNNVTGVVYTTSEELRITKAVMHCGDVIIPGDCSLVTYNVIPYSRWGINSGENPRIHIYHTIPDGLKMVEGEYVGHCVIGDNLVLFTRSKIVGDDNLKEMSSITLYTYTDQGFKVRNLCVSNLGFDPIYPIETLGFTESETLKKIYWVDGRHQMRVINTRDYYDLLVAPATFDIGYYLPTSTITVTRGTSGAFSAGIVQYAVTFAMRDGQESGVAYISPLNYIGFPERGANAEELVQVSFTILIKIGSINYKGIPRIYSIHRTSLDAIPTVKYLGEAVLINGESTYSLFDTGTIGSTVDPTSLLYKGSDLVIPESLAQKDNTLFLGGYKNLNDAISDKLKRDIKNNASITFEVSTDKSVPTAWVGVYPYTSQLSADSSKITSFKSREWYRFGVQVQYTSGKWSEVIWIGDKRCDKTPVLDFSSGTKLLTVGAKVVIPDTETAELAKSARAIRGVVCYPDKYTREVVAQGVLCPTVYSVKDRSSNSPFAQSSWFFRTNYPKVDSSAPGIESMHNKPIKSSEKHGAEIQGLWDKITPNSPYINDVAEYRAFIKTYSNSFFVDQSIVTLHSPDIEFDENITALNSSPLKLRVIGYVPFHTYTRYATVNTDSLGSNDGSVQQNLINYSGTGDYKKLISIGALWRDEYANDSGMETMGEFPIYPWHRASSLNNGGTEENKPAKLTKKIFSSLRVSWQTYYFNKGTLWDADGIVTKDDSAGYATVPDPNDPGIYSGITPVQFFNEDETSMLRIQAPLYSNLDDINYYGNVDTVLSGFGLYGAEGITASQYPLTVATSYTSYNEPNLAYINKLSAPVLSDKYKYAADPIPISYRSTKHAVFGLNYTLDYQQRILPIPKDSPTTPSVGSPRQYPFWNNTKLQDQYVSYNRLETSIAALDPKEYLLLGELYRETTIESRFGGQSQAALEANQWCVAGPSVLISTTTATPTTVRYNIGDSYYQRYDCLKTYPYSDDAVNGIVDIVSFMCESRINIDGRYDRNRGLLNNTAVSPKNFNLLNPIYSQKNNFFSARVIDSSRFLNTDFSSSILWTSTKVVGEDIDSWTNINLLSTLDLDSNKGAITAIRRFNNELYCFQPKGISRILYNSRSQIATYAEGSAALPVELANTGKVEGKVYITDGVGSSNKWSILATPSGLYFIDDLSNDLYLLSAGSMSNLSGKLNFKTWVDQITSPFKWNPSENKTIGFKNVVSYYDSTNGDVYFISNNPDTTVVYSETLGQFSSFYDYDNVPLMFNIAGHWFSLKDRQIWIQNSGEYNSFFGEKKPYSIEIICNTDEPLDKTFNTVEWRATIKESGIDSISTFDHIQVTTDRDYQNSGNVPILNRANRPGGGMFTSNGVNLRRKFRIWRVPIPRDKSNGRDRMRGPWAKIRLSKDTPGNEMMELHDIMVHFFE